MHRTLAQVSVLDSRGSVETANGLASALATRKASERNLSKAIFEDVVCRLDIGRDMDLLQLGCWEIWGTDKLNI
jgi:hypothetical protein